jgi:glycosyltransferase involved in cell wall biosynthesis
MKCLFVNAIKNDNWGGMENWMLKLCASLPALGDDCLVVGRPSSRWTPICRENHLSFEPCTFGGDFTPWVVPRLRAICRRFQPDVAIVKGFRQARFMRRAWPAASIAVKLPFSHELTPALTDRYTFQHCVDLILTDNNGARDAFTTLPWVLPGKIAAIHNGVFIPDAVELPMARISLRQYLNLPADALIIGASGRMTAVKAFNDAIRAFAGMQKPEAHLVIFGNGPEQAALKSLGSQLGLDNRLHFPGWHDDARRLIWGCDAFTHPSLNEGLPNAVLEAMAGGVPVVATTAGGTAEILSGPLTGCLTDLHDVEGMTERLTRLMEDASLRQAMGRLSREHVMTHFSIPAMTVAIRKVLEKTVGLRKTSRAAPLTSADGFQWIKAIDNGVESEARTWPYLLHTRLVSKSAKATVHHIELNGRSFYTKQFTGDRWLLRRLGIRRPLALNNFRAAQQIALLGAETVPHLAAGWSAHLSGRATSLLVTESIPGLITADQWVITHPATAIARNRFVHDLANWLAHLHGSGIAPHDLKFSNILIGEESGHYKFILLDLDNCRFRFLGVADYDAERNLHQLFRSFQKVMTPQEALLFMAVYRQSRQLTKSQARRLFDAAEKRLQRHGHGYKHLSTQSL